MTLGVTGSVSGKRQHFAIAVAIVDLIIRYLIRLDSDNLLRSSKFVVT